MFDLINLLLISHILIDGRDGKAMDVEGQPLPTLVYLCRPPFGAHFHAAHFLLCARIGEGHVSPYG